MPEPPPRQEQTQNAAAGAVQAAPKTHDELSKTTITVSIKTRDRLRKFGKFGERWDDLINHLLDEYEKSKK